MPLIGVGSEPLASVPPLVIRRLPGSERSPANAWRQRTVHCLQLGREGFERIWLGCFKHTSASDGACGPHATPDWEELGMTRIDVSALREGGAKLTKPRPSPRPGAHTGYRVQPLS